MLCLLDAAQLVFGFSLSFALSSPFSYIDIISFFGRFISTHRKTLSDVSLLHGAFIPALNYLLHRKLSVPRRYHEALQSLHREDVTILPYNKVNSVGFLDRSSLLQKAKDLLDDDSTYVSLTTGSQTRIAMTFHRRLNGLASRGRIY